MNRRPRSCLRTARALVLACVPLVQTHVESTIGLPVRIEDVVLPGSELEVVPFDAKSPVELRIVSVAPHGSAFRYEFEATGLEPGEFDLRTRLRHRDGSPFDAQSGAPLLLTIHALFPSNDARPHAPTTGATIAFGGYRTLLWTLGALWAVGLAAILLVKREKRAPRVVADEPRTLADRLRPLVQRAADGQLSRAERAELELSLLTYWQKRLGLAEQSPDTAFARLREHPQAGPLLRSLEEWLHRPAPHAEVDVAALLAPYRDLPDETDFGRAAASSGAR